MSCPYRMDTGAYVLGILAPADRLRMREHVDGCPSCRAEVADFTEVLELLRGLVARRDRHDGCPAD
ncbi:anti-sigma factor family protein [Spirillospora sp. CA-128828]|uniref:anti-sigma factor family protein n=1 Tax=Spirillospora sp. CA-128828 TaxID=3240033 RepID=UPI003D93CE3F